MFSKQTFSFCVKFIDVDTTPYIAKNFSVMSVYVRVYVSLTRLKIQDLSAVLR